MPGYNLLEGLLVLEVSQFGPDALGGILADMGATVIKVEPPVGGDPTRYIGYKALGNSQGIGYFHLRWNRGKKSVAIDLRNNEGRSLFKLLASQADVVIEGLRAGVLARLGLGYEALSSLNERLVYCIVSGMGLTGPYATMASHGPGFDGFGGIGAGAGNGDISLVSDSAPVPIGMHAVSLHAAVGTLAAVFRAGRTGKGALIDVAAADSAVHWLPEHLDAVLNPDKTYERSGFADSKGRMLGWPRLENYLAADGKPILLMAHSDKSWALFCGFVQRPDLLALYERGASEAADTACHSALVVLFAQRSREAWIIELQSNGVPVIPSYSFNDIPSDPQFQARENVYILDHPEVGPLKLTSTAVKVVGEHFAPTPAPALGAHTDEILRNMLKLDDATVAALRTSGVIA
jgi:crotonobetainyl-CoA:carnitine CoA-transferase CaiB-like acyl-CoA transferase